MLTRRALMSGAAAGIIATAGARFSQAQAQGLTKTARIIVGFPAGGGTDVLARILAEGSRTPSRHRPSSRTGPARRRASRSNT